MKKIIFLLFFLISCSARDKNEITIVLDWVPNTNHTGLYVAKDLGYFDEENLKVNIVQAANDSSAVIVAGNKAEFGIYFQANLANRLIKNLPITAVAAILQHNTAGIMTKLNVNNPRELNGKRYSTWEDKIDDATVKHIVGDNLVLVPGETTDALTALNANLFDFIMVYYGWDYLHTKVKNEKVNFFFLKDYEEKFDYYSPIIIANNDYLKGNKEEAKKVIRAIKRGYEYASKNPEKAADILLNNAKELNKELVYESQKYLSKIYLDDNNRWGYIDKTRWDNFYNWLYENNLIERRLESGEGFTNEYLGN